MAGLAMTDSFGSLGRQRSAETRRARATLLDELRQAPSKREGLERCADLLLSGDEALDGLTVVDLIRNCRRVSREAAVEMLRHAEIDSSVRVGKILARDALRLAAVLRSGR